jgi:hypothetical protein
MMLKLFILVILFILLIAISGTDIAQCNYEIDRASQELKDIVNNYEIRRKDRKETVVDKEVRKPELKPADPLPTPKDEPENNEFEDVEFD